MSAPRTDPCRLAAHEGGARQSPDPPRRSTPGPAGVVRGQPGPAADPRVDVLRRAVRTDRGHATRRPGLLHRLAGRRGRAAHRRAGQRGRRGPRTRRRARRRRTRPGLAFAQGCVRLHRPREPPPRARAAEARRRGTPRHADPVGRLAPPEDGRDPAPRRSDPRHRLRRRHRPVPLAARRRGPRRRSAGAAEPGGGVRREPAVARHPGRHQRAGRVRRRDRLPGALGGSHPADPQPVARRQGPRPADGHDPGPDAGAGAAAAAGRGRDARSSSCCAPTRTSGTVATTRSPAVANAASPAATPRP